MTWNCSELGTQWYGLTNTTPWSPNSGLVFSGMRLQDYNNPGATMDGISWNWLIAETLRIQRSWIPTVTTDLYMAWGVQQSILANYLYGVGTVPSVKFFIVNYASASHRAAYINPTYTEVPSGYRQTRNTGIDWTGPGEFVSLSGYNAGITNRFLRSNNTSGAPISDRWGWASGKWGVLAMLPFKVSTPTTPSSPGNNYLYSTVIGSTHNSVGVIDTTGAFDFTVNNTSLLTTTTLPMSNTRNSQMLKMDLSLKFNSSSLVALGMKCNEPFGKMMAYVALYLNISTFKYRWLQSATNSMTVELYSGSMPIDTENPVEGTLLGTFTGIYSGDFTSADANGVFYLASWKSMTAVADGTASYVKIKGCYTSTGVYPTLWMPVSGTPVQNTCYISKVNGIVAGDTITMMDLGFKFAIGV